MNYAIQYQKRFLFYPDEEAKKTSKRNTVKLVTRDMVWDLGGGKIQRDAICTRGRQRPFSNRNLRWHPLIVAENKPGLQEK